MPHWIHFVFIIIWFFFGSAFAILSCQAYQSQTITLTRVTGEAPEGIVTIEGPKSVDIGRAFNIILAVNNKNVDLLESSIRQSAKIAFILNGGSCLAAFVGFIAQIGVYRQDYRNRHSKKHPNKNTIKIEKRTRHIDEDIQKKSNDVRNHP